MFRTVPHRHVVAGAFHAASLALGIPSSLAFVFLAWESVRLRLTRPAAADTGSTGSQLFDLLAAGARALGTLFGLLGQAAEWAFTLLAAASLVAVVVAAILFFLARGLDAGRTWARILGICLALICLLFCFAVLTSLRRPVPLALSTIAAVASAYVIWTLGWRFA